MKLRLLVHHLFGLGAAVLVGVAALDSLADSGPVKVTIQTAPNQSGEGASLPIDPKPRVRYGKNHLFNNLWTSSGDNYCIRAGTNAGILVENSAFVGVASPQAFNSTADQGTSYITSNGNLYSNATGTQSTGGGGTPFTKPPYTYTLDAASGVQSEVQSGAGPK